VPLTLHISHPSLDCQIIDARSVLISGVLPDKLPEIAHTSLGDLQAREIIELAQQYQELYFHDAAFDPDSDIFKETQVLLNFLQHEKTIKNYQKTDPVDFYKYSPMTCKDACLWVFGCSHSYGFGIESSQRYGELLAKQLCRPLALVAQIASSLSWSLDQIHRSNIKSSDIVVWQITTPLRTMKFDGELKHILLSNANRYYLEVFTDQQMFFDHVRMLRQGINYLRAKNIRFVMTSLDIKDPFYYQYLKEYTQHREYCYTPGVWVDLASDNQHPGPLSNRSLADRLYFHIQSMTQSQKTTT
jgi:hypothetical protein